MNLSSGITIIKVKNMILQPRIKKKILNTKSEIVSCLMSIIMKKKTIKINLIDIISKNFILSKLFDWKVIRKFKKLGILISFFLKSINPK